MTLQRLAGGHYGGGVLRPSSTMRGVNVADATRITISRFTCLGGANSVVLANDVTNSKVFRGADSSTSGVSLGSGSGNSVVQ